MNQENKDQKKNPNEELFELKPRFSEKNCRESLEEVCGAWNIPSSQRDEMIEEFLIHINLKILYDKT